MNYKLKKDYYHRIKDKLIFIPKDTIIQEKSNQYEYSDGINTIQISKKILSDYHELFEPIEDKMTWEKLMDEIYDPQLFKTMPFMDDLLKILQEHCILKDELKKVVSGFVQDGITHDLYLIRQ